MRALKLAVFAAVAVGFLSGFTGCSSGSSADNPSNPDTSQPPGGSSGVTYNGPAPQTDDVQNFRLNVWDNLAAETHCGACHGVGGQVPQFVRDDDINLAYNAANTIVDLRVPANSRMVSKVAEGHNCWESNASVCGDIITNYIEGWAGDGGNANVIALTAPTIQDVGASKTFPSSSAEFDTLIYQPYLRQYCASCHAEDGAVAQQQPYFAGSNVDDAYQAAKSKINLDIPASSRFVVRLGDESHGCWDNCANNAAAMEAAIAAFSDGIPVTTVDADLVLSKALRLTDGIVASSGGRVESNVIALYEFKAGSGSTAFDTSGVTPSLNLQLSGDYEWVGSWGIRFNSGKAQGSTANSRKLFDFITTSGEYSIEAWVIPDNVNQDGPARIVTYSGGNETRNFTLGQTLYNYNYLNRSSVTDANGNPDLSTADAAERLQATLQHVVLTFDPVEGRRIYVNGEYTGDADDQGGASLNSWDDSFALALASEVSNSDRWAGTVRLLAIHNRALSDEQVLQNFDAGVGEKFFLLFSVTDLINVPDSYVVFEAQQFDNYGYLFNTPFFVSLDANAQLSDIPLQGMRIGINGREAKSGQAYANLETVLSDANYVAGRQDLSPLGTVLALEKGPTDDEFFLSFDRLGDNTYVRTPVTVPVPGAPADLTPRPRIGMRTFDEINATLAAATGVSQTNSEVAATYATVKQQLPTVPYIDGFLAANQMAVTQLAVKYCSELVDDTGLRASFFPGFNFSASAATAFDTPAKRDQVISPLLDRLLANDIAGSSLSTQPDPAVVSAELNGLIDKMVACGSGCASDRTPTVVKATCAAAVGNAVMLVQ